MTGERLLGSESRFFKADATGDAGGVSVNLAFKADLVLQQIKDWHAHVEGLRNRSGALVIDPRKGLPEKAFKHQEPTFKQSNGGE